MTDAGLDVYDLADDIVQPRRFHERLAMPEFPNSPPDQNPYLSPSSGERGELSVTESDGQLASPRAIEILVQTRPWVRFLSVLGFLATLLLTVMGLMGGLLGAKGGGALADEVFGCLLLGALYFFPSLFLWRYAERISNLQATQSVSDIEAALEAQRSFWRFVGIAVALMLTLCAVLLPLAALFSILLPDQQ